MYCLFSSAYSRVALLALSAFVCASPSVEACAAAFEVHVSVVFGGFGVAKMYGVSILYSLDSCSFQSQGRKTGTITYSPSNGPNQ